MSDFYNKYPVPYKYTGNPHHAPDGKFTSGSGGGGGGGGGGMTADQANNLSDKAERAGFNTTRVVGDSKSGHMFEMSHKSGQQVWLKDSTGATGYSRFRIKSEADFNSAKDFWSNNAGKTVTKIPNILIG